MRGIIPISLAALTILGAPACSLGQSERQAASASPIEISISGPRVVIPGQGLNLRVTLVNRSDAPIALSFVDDGWWASRFEWKITDRSGRVLPPPAPTGPTNEVCLLNGPVPEDMIQVLQPGEHYIYSKDEDPSAIFAFPGKGFYEATVRFRFDPASLTSLTRINGLPQSPLQEMKGPKRTLLYKTPTIDVTSNSWQFYLAN